jgi:uncharacterized protein YdeI (YjbR/CyaY-like superfamily)
VKLDGVGVTAFGDAAAFERWLTKNHQRREGIWLKIAKKNSGRPSITSDEAVDVGLCWGWISGQRLPFDETFYLQKYVPRRSGSVWSQVNVKKVEALNAAGRMRGPGLAEVTAAEKDGRWNAAYASQRTATAPKDLLQALARNRAAGKVFAELNRTERYAIILRLIKERIPSRRATLLKRIVADLQKQQRR